MLVNESTVLVGEKVVLVPYQVQHVPKYHEWMSDAETREATASEELSLEEEYEMQQSWRLDSDKLTFIVCERLSSIAVPPHDPEFLTQHDLSTMVGDVNIFLSKEFDDVEEDEDGSTVGVVATSEPILRAEMELMIAVKTSRRKGLGSAALRVFLSYASQTLSLPPSAFFARISTSNTGSIQLFEGLGFKKGKISEVFQEVEMVWGGGDHWAWRDTYETLTVPRDAAAA